MAANPAGKERKGGEAPYMTWQRGDWTWFVLKSWQVKNSKPGARWFCRVVTPYAPGAGDLGDTYVYDIVVAGQAELVDWDRSVWPKKSDVMAYVGEPQPIPGFTA